MAIISSNPTGAAGPYSGIRVTTAPLAGLHANCQRPDTSAASKDEQFTLLLTSVHATPNTQGMDTTFVCPAFVTPILTTCEKDTIS